MSTPRSPRVTPRSAEERGWGLVAAAVSACCVALGCGGRGAESPAARPYTGPLVDSHALVPDFLWQQEITASRGPFSHSFPAALQSSGGVLTVLGLTPFRTRAFSIEQRGREFEFTQFVDLELPLQPDWVLIDIHRTFFDGLAPHLARDSEARGDDAPEHSPRADGAPKDRALADGVHEVSAQGERRRDVWQSGRLVRRTYERLDAPGKLITIDYGRGYRWGEPPPRLLFDNGWYGYRLEVVTTSAETLAPEAPREDVPP